MVLKLLNKITAFGNDNPGLPPKAATKPNQKKPDRKHSFRAFLAAYQLLEDLKRTHAGKKVRLLDIGGAHGIHARFFRSHGIQVDLVDLKPGDEMPIFVGDYLDFKPEKPYDVIWSSHMLEHVENPSLFLRKMHADLAEDGYCVVSVPPFIEATMGHGHISMWNTGILLLNAYKTGFDPATARLAKYDYNISLIAKKRQGPLPEPYLSSFPKEMQTRSPYHFRGDIEHINWQVTADKLPCLDGSFNNDNDILAAFRKTPGIQFCQTTVKGKPALLYYDREQDTLYRTR